MSLTNHQYETQLQVCHNLFAAKMRDYGTAWRVLRLRSLTDQLYIKARRIRTIEEAGVQSVADSVVDEYIGIVNYGLIALIQSELPDNAPLELPHDDTLARYMAAADSVKQLMIQKNHDYGEAWRSMRLSSLTDLILMKIYRIKQIEDLPDGPEVSEGVAANYRDMINYALFALILIHEKQN
jgi:hypothetical protein